MSTAILATKLHVPALRDELVPRPHLLQKLSNGRSAKLTLVSAPAGFGKTTLVGAWLRQVEEAVAWLSLDEEDSDIVRFLSYFVAALQTVEPQLGRSIEHVIASTGRRFSLEPLLTDLINEIDALAKRLVLVLDDFHFISSEVVQDALRYLLEHLPSQMHLVLLTRVDPPLPLARLRVRGHLTEIRSRDLRFRSAETSEFFDRVANLKLAPDELKALSHRIEGWAAGLQLAALSLRERGNKARFIHEFTGGHRYIMDYLTDEVLERLPPPLRQFLLQSAILNRFTASLCEALISPTDCACKDSDVETGGAQTILEHLEAANLFLVPLDSDRHWYRYHHLFAEVLRKKLMQERPQLLPLLHARASAWYEAQARAEDAEEFMPDAIYHALAAEKFKRAARLIAQVAEAMAWQRGQIGTLRSWLNALPDEALLREPSLAVTFALLLLWSNEHAEAELILNEVARVAAEGVPVPLRVLGHAAAFRAALAEARGDANQALREAETARDLLPTDNTGISMGIIGGVYAAQGNVESALQAYDGAAILLQEAEQYVPLMVTHAYRGRLQVARGRLQYAHQIYTRALRQANSLMQAADLAER